MSKHPRGDVPVTINGKTIVLQPKFKTVTACEAVLGCGLLDMIASASRFHITTVATVLFQAIREAGETELTFDEVGEAVLDSLGDDETLGKAALSYLNAFFPKKQGDGKKPEAPEVTG